MGWTEESVAELRRLWDKGLTANEIAKKLGVTKNAIVGKVHRLCLKARPSPIKPKTDENEELVVETTEEIIVAEPVEETITEVVEVEEVADKKSKKSETDRTKLIDLDSHTCRWPIGDPRDDDFGFCGKKVRVGQTYCDEHAAIAYVKSVRK
jgi:GcrA cell cycle regulator